MSTYNATMSERVVTSHDEEAAGRGAGIYPKRNFFSLHSGSPARLCATCRAGTGLVALIHYLHNVHITSRPANKSSPWLPVISRGRSTVVRGDVGSSAKRVGPGARAWVR
jgi:hypothetical protein